MPSVGESSAEQARDLWDVVDERDGRGGTLVTSQGPVGQWHSLLPDATTTGGILDRLVHQAYQVELTGDSLRKHLPSPD